MFTAVTPKLRALGWERFAWLVYGIPFVAAALQPALSARESAVQLAAFVLFLAAYFAGYSARGWQILALVAVMDLLAAVFTTRNTGTVAFWIYGAALVGNLRPARHAAMMLAVQVAVGGAIPAWLGMPVWYYLTSALISALVGAVTIQAAVNDDRNARLRLAQEEVERLAKVAERERIARDLHDLLGHTLSVIVLKSELARKLVSRDAARATQEIEEVERIAREGLAEVRTAITGYRSSGVQAEMEHVRKALLSAGIDATVEAHPVRLDAAQDTALSLALREAATNVIRHAGATRCHIRFYAQDGSVLMEVADNGRGGNAPFGHGLTGMRERIQALGGVLQRDSDHGTRLQIRLPLSAN
jgi:two-component system, NarL family, sensor histidine kinase DesK